MKRKILAMVLSLAMLLQLVAVTSFATDAATICLNTTETAVKEGQTFTVTADLSNNPGFADLQIEIGYDNTVLTLVSAVADSAVGVACTAAQKIDKNPYNMGWTNFCDITFNGTLATLTFSVKEGAKLGDTDITLDFYKGRNGNYTDGYDINFNQNFEAVAFKYEKATVTVVEDSVAVTGVSLNKTATTLTMGGSETLTATVTPANAGDKSVRWSSSNAGVATVSSSGVVTAVAAGIATITATTADGNKTANCTVTVNPVATEETDVTFTIGSAACRPGDTVRLTLSVQSEKNINTMGLTALTYDTSVLTFKGFEDHGELITSSAFGAGGVDTAKATITLGYMNSSKLTGDICTLEFLVNEDAPDGEYEVSLYSIAKNSSTVISSCVLSGTVDVKQELLGDINWDETIDVNDAVALLQYSIFPDLYPILYRGSVDFNHDDAVDVNDAVMLLQYSIFPELYPLQ